MKLLLLEIRAGKPYPVARLRSPFFRNEERTEETRFQRIKRSIKTTYRELAKRLPYHERLCVQLRRARSIELIHSSRKGEERARADFQAFLGAQHQKHTFWLVLDGVLAVVGAFLTPIPGPNIFFFYPAARCWGHYLARSGAGRALTHDRISLQIDPLMDQLETHRHDPEKKAFILEEIIARYNLVSLRKVLKALD